MLSKALHRFWRIQRFVFGSNEKPPSQAQKNMLQRLNVDQTSILTYKMASIAIERALHDKQLAKLEAIKNLSTAPHSNQPPASDLPTPAQRQLLEKSGIALPEGCNRKTASLIIDIVQERDKACQERDALRALVGKAMASRLPTLKNIFQLKFLLKIYCFYT